MVGTTKQPAPGLNNQPVRESGGTSFVYGQHRGRKTPDGRITVEKLSRDQWTALIHDAHPAYISWEQFELNQRLPLANAQAHGSERAAGPAREGPALLQGLAVCGRCGRRMTVGYHKRRSGQSPHYRCMGIAIEDGVPPCQAIPGTTIDAAISQLLLDTVSPLALEVALNVQAELEARADEADTLRRTHVERARHRADAARRRYLAADPDNRLVADTLEADWNDALRQHQDAQDDYARATGAQATLTDEHKARIRALAADFPALWSDPATPQRERKRMARLLIEDITIAKTDQIHLHVRFRGRADHQPCRPHPAIRRRGPPDQPRYPGRPRPPPRHPHRRAGRQRPQRRRSPLRHRTGLHAQHRVTPPPQQRPTQPPRTPLRQRHAHHP
jgi:hypothetical protein